MEDHAVELSQLEISQSATLFTDDEIQENIEISKELFLLVIHDRGVQAGAPFATAWHSFAQVCVEDSIVSQCER